MPKLPKSSKLFLPSQLKLEQLKKWRNPRERDVSMGFLEKYFKHEIELPYKKLNGFGAIWQELVPPKLTAHTRLTTLRNGILHVAVDTSAHLFELDRELRSGLERQLVQAFKQGTLRRIKLFIAPIVKA